MKFELQFDKETYKKQMDLLFDLAWKKKIAYYKNSQYLGFALLLIGLLLYFDRPGFLYCVPIFFGLSIVIPYFYYYFKIKSHQKGFEIAKIEEIKTYENQNLSTFEFTEKSLIIGYRNSFRELNWTEFINYKVYEKNIFMFTNKYEPIILDEIEVGPENFKKIIEYISDKIPPNN